jgi:hypothetical protein
MFLQDGCAPHKAASMHQKLAGLLFEVETSACSPGLARLYYYLFLTSRNTSWEKVFEARMKPY